MSVNQFVIVMGGFNGDLGDSLGEKAKHEPNQRGLKLLDFAHSFMRPKSRYTSVYSQTRIIELQTSSRWNSKKVKINFSTEK